MPSLSDVASTTGFTDLTYWPTIVAALAAEGIDDEPTLTAAAATLKAELGGQLKPVAERYNGDPYTYFESRYGSHTAVGKKLGNTAPGDGYRYRGRGFIQLTGKSNYDRMSRRIGVDLLGDPDAALTPLNAARIFAAYFRDAGVAQAARAGDWTRVRKLVNGGLNGWDVFKGVVDGLLAKAKSLVTPPTPPPPGQAGRTTVFIPSALGLLAAGGLLLYLLSRRGG